jgi:hypothetical protein
MKTTKPLIVVAIALVALAHLSHAQTFTKITDGDIVNDVATTCTGCAWGDFNNNGFLDAFVCIWSQKNVQYLNNRDGTFTKVTAGDPFQDADAHLGAAVADYDNDGYPDLVVAAGGAASTAEASRLYIGGLAPER